MSEFDTEATAIAVASTFILIQSVLGLARREPPILVTQKMADYRGKCPPR
ncbi:hypothetical protein [Suicoccus acidiformans]|nr:hypothetical protein [Suicoccus acidiformans]